MNFNRGKQSLWLLLVLWQILEPRPLAANQCCEFPGTSCGGSTWLLPSDCTAAGGTFVANAFCCIPGTGCPDPGNCLAKPGGGDQTCFNIPQDICVALAGGSVAIPTLSQGGLVTMAALLFLAAAYILIRTRLGSTFRRG